MNSATVIAYVSAGDIYCPDCAATWDAEYHGCGEKTQLSDPGWHDCGKIGPDGSPCHAKADTTEGEASAVFADSADENIGATCGRCGACFGPDSEWSEPNCDAKQWRWSRCPRCNSQKPFSRSDTDARYRAFIGELDCTDCGRGAVHF